MRWSNLTFVAPGGPKRSLGVVYIAASSEVSTPTACDHVGNATDVVGARSKLGEPHHGGIVQQRAAVFLHGVELVQKVRKIKSCADTKIIMVSTESSQELMDSVMADGANGFINKPFTLF